MRQYLINLSMHYKGDYRQIEKQLLKGTKVPEYHCSSNILTILDSQYPSKLLDLESPPLVLYYYGNLELLQKDSVGIIGSRNPSAYAIRKTIALVEKIRERLVIVSGLAYGIDSIAHKAAINHETIAVLGCGLDVYYPKSHEMIQRHIAKWHCLVTEFPPGTQPMKHHFPIRNRIIAALSDHLCIMAAEIRSGTIATAEEALKINREIVCLPHNIDEKASLGCNTLISEGASVLTNI